MSFSDKFISFMLVVLTVLFPCRFGYIEKDANPIEKKGYTIVFDEEFDGNELDSEKWLPQYFPHATDTPEGCVAKYKIDDGILNLYIDESSPQYGWHTIMRASCIQTFEKNLLHPGAGEFNRTEVEPFEGFATKYGYFEMRAKLPDIKEGGHIAWWLIGTQDDALPDGSGSVQTGEIDILENLFESINTFSPKVHPWTDSKIKSFRKDIEMHGNYSEAFHIYGMDWTPKGIKFYIDGHKIAETKDSPDYRMCMFLGIYTNCDFSGMDNGIYPKEFLIDYVRVYKSNKGY